MFLSLKSCQVAGLGILLVLGVSGCGKAGPMKLSLSGHTAAVICVAYSADGKHIASGGRDPNDTVRIWDARSGNQLHVLPIQETWVNSIAFDADGEKLLVGEWGGIATVWSVETGKVLQTAKGPKGNFLGFSPDRTLCACGTGDADNPGDLYLWELASGKEAFVGKGHALGVVSAAFSPDETLVASGSMDATVRVWRKPEKKAQAVLKGHFGVIHCLAFSPDGKRLASGSADGTVRVWDMSTWRQKRVIEGHRSDVYHVAFRPDGTRILSASRDRTVKVWDPRLGAELLSLDGHDSGVISAAWSPDGSRIATGSTDKTLKVWEAAAKK